MQRAMTIIGAADDEAEAAIAAFAASKGWRVSVAYTAEDVDGEHRLFDPTPLGECTTLDDPSNWGRDHWASQTLGTVQRLTLIEAWRMYGGLVRTANGKNFRGGTQFIQICSAMRVRGLRFADADPPTGFYTVRQWRDEYQISSHLASRLVGTQVSGPDHLRQLHFGPRTGFDSFDDVRDMCGYGKVSDELIRLLASVQSRT